MDAVVGLALIIAGFVLQAASAFWSGWLWELAGLAGALAGALIAYRVMLPKLVERGSEDVIAFLEAKLKQKG